jgi:hypothetical protein
LKGTVVSFPQAEHVVTVSTRSRAMPAPAGRAARLPLQALQRFGSFLKFLSAKNCCSPAVQTNSAAQSTHLRIRSWNSIDHYLVGVGLFRFAPELLTIAFPRERLLCPSFVTRFQIEGMLLDVLDDVFLLNFPLEPAESAFDRFALLNFYFSHATNTPFAGGTAVSAQTCKYVRLSQQTRILGAIPVNVNEITSLALRPRTIEALTLSRSRNESSRHR